MSESSKTEHFFDNLRRQIEGRTGPLDGKKALIMGIANDRSIAYGCALAFRSFGASLAVTYLNEKTRTFTQPLAERLEAPLYLPCDVCEEGQSPKQDAADSTPRRSGAKATY